MTLSKKNKSIFKILINEKMNKKNDILYKKLFYAQEL